MSVTTTFASSSVTKQWPRYGALKDDSGISDEIPATTTDAQPVTDNPSPEERSVVQPKPRRRMDRKAMAVMAAATTVVVLVVTLWNSLFLVNTGEVAVVSFGGDASVYYPGGHFKAPWQSVDKFQTSYQMSTWSSAPSSNDGGNGSIITTARDSVWVNIDLRVTYRLQNLESIEKNWRNYGSQDALRAQIDRTIAHATQTAFLGFTATEIWHRDARIEQAVHAEVDAQLKARFGIELGNVVITNCAFNEEVTRGLNAQARVMSAKG